jgi:DNA-binding CsgD family transcriptional regulator
VAESARDFQLTSLPIHRAMLQVMKARILLARGQQEAAGEALSNARELLRSAPFEDQHQLPFGTTEILLRLTTAGPPAALAAASATMDRYDFSGSSSRHIWPLLTAAASACVAAARQAGAGHDGPLGGQIAVLADRLRTIAEKTGVAGNAQRAHELTLAAADAELACLLAAPGSAGQAERSENADGCAGPVELLAAWDRAAAAWEAVSEPYPQAQALLEAAESAAGCGDREGAAARLTRAAALAARLGAVPLGEQIGALARRARIPLAGDGADAASRQTADFGLTGRELEVLRLVCAGRSNREIAAELFISPKTASVHVSNIMAKLGAASRGEAAATAHALRMFEAA